MIDNNNKICGLYWLFFFLILNLEFKNKKKEAINLKKYNKKNNKKK
jgi:hypothetical protein